MMAGWLKRSLLLSLLLLIPVPIRAQRLEISLDGEWEFRIDPDNKGLQERWFEASKSLGGRIVVPGCWQTQGIGEPRDYLRHDYVGLAWYKRVVEIPKEWAGKQVWLKVGGVSRSAQVFFNEQLVGYHNGFSAPFRVDVSRAIRPGAKNTIAVAVDNSAGSQERKPLNQRDTSRPVGTFNHLGNWGGLYSHVSLEATGSAWVENVHVRTRINPPESDFHLVIRCAPGFASRPLKLQVRAKSRDEQSGPYMQALETSISPGEEKTVTVRLPMPRAKLWSPETPDLYVAQVELLDQEGILDSIVQPFGMREFVAREGKFFLNGQPYYLRGFGDWSAEVLSGTPPVSLEENRRRIQIVKKYGFNFVRFHSRIPPEEFFQAADELGLLVHAELPVLYSPYLLPHWDYLLGELRHALLAFRNHPSFVSFATGNELRPLPGKEKEFLQVFSETYQEAKKLHPDLLVMATDGPQYPPSDYYSLARGFARGATTIAHEFGGWYCSLPDLSLAPRFTGVIEPYWFRDTETWLKERGLLEIYPRVLLNSQRLLLAGKRFRVEKLRQIPHVYGYQLWLITDYPSGTPEGYIAEEGVLNYFWEPKSMSAEEFYRFNGPTALLVDSDISQRTWWQGASYWVNLHISHFGGRDLKDATLIYRLEAGEKVLLEGRVNHLKIANGTIGRVATLKINVPALAQATACLLKVRLLEGGETVAENAWTYWVYPSERLKGVPSKVISRLQRSGLKDLYPFIASSGSAGQGDVLLLRRLDSTSFREILDGASAILFIPAHRYMQQVPFEFLPTFTGRPHAIGTIVESHPLFAQYPNEGFCDFQFYNLLDGATAFTERFSRLVLERVRPLVWGVWSSGEGLEKLGFLYEFRVGKGKVLLTTMNVVQYLDEGFPEVLYLFDQMLRYVTSSHFRPDEIISEEEFSRLLTEPRS